MEHAVDQGVQEIRRYVQLSSATSCLSAIFKMAVSNGMYTIVHLPRLGHTLICLAVSPLPFYVTTKFISFDWTLVSMAMMICYLYCEKGQVTADCASLAA